MELLDNAIVLAVPGAMDAGLASWLFWASLALSLALAFVLTTPVNRWMIGRGKGTRSCTPTTTEQLRSSDPSARSEQRSSRTAQWSTVDRVPPPPVSGGSPSATVLPEGWLAPPLVHSPTSRAAACSAPPPASRRSA